MSEASPQTTARLGEAWSWLRWLLLAPIVLVVFGLGFLTARLLAPLPAPPENGEGAAVTLWTCSMHPQIKLPAAGPCPICAMDLIPLADDGAAGAAVLEMSEAALKLAEVETARVERRFAEAELRFVGKVDYDETRVKTITAWAPGRLDRLYVDYTGVAVSKGDHLVYLYSPDLISSQEELLQALRAVEELADSSSAFIKETAEKTVTAAREKLRLLGLTPGQIQAMEQSGKVRDHLTIYAPVGGIVVHKNAIEGMYVKTGTPIYTIADLSYVWVYLEAYESDLAWLRYGQTVTFETEAYPGDAFRGRISFIDPVLDTRTRTVRVRVNVPNDKGRLKPGLFIRATVRARMAAEGRVMEGALVGKWISPMHPEIVKDAPGDCDVCGMPLVRAESLGLADATSKLSPPLLVPRSAVLITGKRAVVYVKTSEGETSSFEGRQVILGPRAGDSYIVKAGLAEGDEVVTQGAFKIDSALQIRARPSMMTSPDAVDHEGHEHSREAASANIEISAAVRPKLRHLLADVLSSALSIGERLAADGLEHGAAAEQLGVALVALAGGSPDATPEAWNRLVSDMSGSARTLAGAAELEAQRGAYSSLSQSLLAALRAVGAPRAVDEVRCPMAFGGLGASWLQEPGAIRNPYFGASMLRCGSVVATLTAADGD